LPCFSAVETRLDSLFAQPTPAQANPALAFRG
jgi:hypothetical protein